MMSTIFKFGAAIVFALAFLQPGSAQWSPADGGVFGYFETLFAN